jgi:aryl-alcohol dehydrogenase-like predicted oxidoreductase
MKQETLKAKEIFMAGLKVSQVAFGTEHLNQFTPEFGGAILRDAALQNNVFFWDTDNCYGSQPAVSAGMKMLPREKIVVTSKTYARTEKEAEESISKILHDLDTPYLDICLLHGVGYGELRERLPALRALCRMREEGLIRRTGLSTHSATVALEASDIEGIQILCTTFNSVGRYMDEGTIDKMAYGLRKAHEKGVGTYVIKTLGRGILTEDTEKALRWVMGYHEYIDVYNIGFGNLRELRQDLGIVNHFYDELEEEENG